MIDSHHRFALDPHIIDFFRTLAPHHGSFVSVLLSFRFNKSRSINSHHTIYFQSQFPSYLVLVEQRFF